MINYSQILIQILKTIVGKQLTSHLSVREMFHYQFENIITRFTCSYLSEQYTYLLNISSFSPNVHYIVRFTKFQHRTGN